MGVPALRVLQKIKIRVPMRMNNGANPYVKETDYQ